MIESEDYKRFKKAIQDLPPKNSYSREDLLIEGLLFDRHGDIEIYYAPHNELINPSAGIVIAGITPGWRQMEIAYRTLKQAFGQGLTEEEAFSHAKAAARFAGSMRMNLLQMLRDLGLHHYVGLPDVESLFAPGCQLLHTTSVLRYPVFVQGRNYTGHQPPLMTSAYLRPYALQFIGEEIMLLNRQRPLFIPLGRTVEELFRSLVNSGLIEEGQCLWGFPHPSGANGHRHQQFRQAHDGMLGIISRFFAAQ
ncbi:hypothetical protein ACFOLF_27745 [Paenibacillus sepulcri]|uniref:Uracil-DNA glycosylase-like domain-containing protein n=1 Tax=Paenibacillus sepulcri TaxID=359917 RepID=A0ABS7CDX1_9BACL|nr:hypothetical protein [Paenibacillus sepulcri]